MEENMFGLPTILHKFYVINDKISSFGSWHTCCHSCVFDLMQFKQNIILMVNICICLTDKHKQLFVAFQFNINWTNYGSFMKLDTFMFQ